MVCVIYLTSVIVFRLYNKDSMSCSFYSSSFYGIYPPAQMCNIEVFKSKYKINDVLFAAPYVKVYLLENGACIAKKKTRIARKTLDPLYQQTLVFDESPQGKVLQVSSFQIPI